MSTGRAAAATDLRKSIQNRADELGLGVEILFVGLQDIHPPTKVAADYQKIVGARQTVEAQILAARGKATRDVLIADSEARKMVNEAEAYRTQRVAGAAATAARFTNQIHAFNAAPTVYPMRAYLQTFARAVGPARKYIVATTNSSEVIQFNLEDKIREGLDEIYVPPTRAEGNSLAKPANAQPQMPKAP
jgi:membrane protease subunit HflK